MVETIMMMLTEVFRLKFIPPYFGDCVLSLGIISFSAS